MSVDRHAEPREIKQREIAFERLREEIRREAGNLDSLQQAKSRVLARPEVRADPLLAAMLRAFIAERETLLAALHPREEATLGHATALAAGGPHEGTASALTHAEALADLARLEEQFYNELARFREDEAGFTYDKIAALVRQCPQWIAPERVERLGDELRRLRERRGRFEDQIDELVNRAVTAATAGDHDTAAGLLKKLSSIHAAYPQLFSDARFAAVRERIMHASPRAEDREVARRIVERERAVATELKELVDRIHRFHQLARSGRRDESYRREEAAYHQAVREVRSHDTEWLASLVLEMVSLLEEWGHAPEKAKKQVDHFLASVRGALSHLRKEIGEIEHGR